MNRLPAIIGISESTKAVDVMNKKIYRKPEIRTNIVRLGVYGDYGSDPGTRPIHGLTTETYDD